MRDDPGKLPEGRSPIVLYQTEGGRSRIQVRLENEGEWKGNEGRTTPRH